MFVNQMLIANGNKKNKPHSFLANNCIQNQEIRNKQKQVYNYTTITCKSNTFIAVTAL